MTYAAVADLAMVLPLPVAPNPPEDAVRFINLERYPTFFDEMRSGFPVNEVHSRSRSVALYSFSAPELRVHDVGKFEASFVPRIDDFDRLNERFHIPRDVWDTLPLYRDYGFAVFKLKGRRLRRIPGFLRRLFGGGSSNGQAEPYQVHPMAFEFPMRNPDLLYFPTVHVHDRKIHPHAMFDHMLYCQAGPEMDMYLQGWEKSFGPASQFMNVASTEGIIDPNHCCRRRPLEGRLENRDTLVGIGGYEPEFLAV